MSFRAARYRLSLQQAVGLIVVLLAGSFLAGCGSTGQSSGAASSTFGAGASPTAQAASATPSQGASPAVQTASATPSGGVTPAILVPASSQPISHSAAGIRISLEGVGLEGQFILTRFQVSPAAPDSHPDLGHFGVLMAGGVFPSIDMQLSGLAWPQQYFPMVTPIDPVKNSGYPATPTALKYRTAKAYDVTIPFKLLAAPGQPVTINIARLLFNNPNRNVVNGPWGFSFVPAKIGVKVDAPPIATDVTVARIQPVLNALQKANLVFPIDKTVGYGGQQITLLAIACDRDITYLTYRTDDGQPVDPSIIDVRNNTMTFLQSDLAATPILPSLPVSAAPSTVYWLAFNGLPAETRKVFLQVMPGAAGGPTAGLGTPVPSLDHGSTGPRLPRLDPLSVDLSPLAKLPQPETISGHGSQAKGHGVQLQAFQLKRGYAVSTIEVSANVTNSDLLVAAEDPTTPQEALTMTPSVTVDNQSFTVIENNVQAQHGVATDDLRLLNLPQQGTLTITFDQQYVAFDAGKKVAYAKGPWTLRIDLTQTK